MINTNVKVKDNVLTITVDLSKRNGPSKSGKTTVIASSQGNQLIAPDTYLGVNVYTK